jgi:hypothetical protein
MTALGDAQRDVVFVSHANPEDNELALWLTLQLVREGYRVWCDLTGLVGGEVFWEDVQFLIRKRTAKFVFVLTRASNAKPGALDELELAKSTQRANGLHDFIVPAWSDDLPPKDFYVGLARINAIPFQNGWAPGLAKLLKKFAEDGVPRDPNRGPSDVSQWWRGYASPDAGLGEGSEITFSNWYRLSPATIYFHELDREGPGPLSAGRSLPYPAVQHNQYLVSFAPREDLEVALPPGVSITASLERRVNSTTGGDSPRLWTYAEERTKLYQLLNQSWMRFTLERQLPLREFSGSAKALFFRKGMLPNDRVEYSWPNGMGTWRQIVGTKTLKGVDGAVRGARYWHFALEAKPTVQHPDTGFMMKPHVLFSDDGFNLWDSHERMHRARRSQCRGWWNDKWRDLIAGTVTWLAGDADCVRLPVGRSAILELELVPVTFRLPRSFDDTVLRDDVDEQPSTELDPTDDADNDWDEEGEV